MIKVNILYPNNEGTWFDGDYCCNLQVKEIFHFMLKVYTRRVGDVVVLCLQGQIVIGETTALRDAVLSQSEASIVLLDLSRVSRIDAGGLSALLKLREQTLSRQVEFRLINVTRLVKQVLEITCLDSVFVLSSAKNLGATHERAATGLELAPCA